MQILTINSSNSQTKIYLLLIVVSRAKIIILESQVNLQNSQGYNSLNKVHYRTILI